MIAMEKEDPVSKRQKMKKAQAPFICSEKQALSHKDS
jgi:hypothetical protein